MQLRLRVWFWRLRHPRAWFDAKRATEELTYIIETNRAFERWRSRQ